MHTNNDETKKIPIGSGEIFMQEYTGEIPADSVIETEDNRLGHIEGGASIEYTPTYYNAKDDLNKVKKTILTDEIAKLKCGIITWNANTIEKLSANATVTEAGGKRTMKIGGILNQNIKNYLFRFVNKDNVDGDIRITVVGNNQSGINLSFAKDKEVKIEPEIEVMPMQDGTLILYEEEILTAASAMVNLMKED